ncbi:MAG: Hpt domain-containing protein [Candidatus Sulfotelmatobacter sp.]
MDIDHELLLKSFVSETAEGLAQMEGALLELESHPDDVELVNTVFRVVHTFKGNAGIFELKHAQEFAHALEDLLDKIRTRELSFSPDVADVLLASMAARVHDGGGSRQRRRYGEVRETAATDERGTGSGGAGGETRARRSLRTDGERQGS